MERGSKVLVVAVVAAIAVTAVLAVALRGRLRCSGFAGPGVTALELPAGPAAADRLRIASWNLRNFPLDERPQDPDLGYSRRTNICDLEAVLGGLEADLMGLQEVNDTRRFPPILRRAVGQRAVAVRFSADGGRFGQHLAIAWDTSRLELVGEPVEIAEVAFEPGTRPAFAAYFRTRRTPALDFTFVVVHHESGRDGFADRRRQNRALGDWIAARSRVGGDPDFIVVGDFNTAGSPRGGLAGELQSVDDVLGRAGLDRLDNATGCTQYWEGSGGLDGIQVPSLLDHVYVGGFNATRAFTPLQSWLHCARHDCREFVSRPGAEDGTFWDVSDHCPLTFEIRVADLEGQGK